MWTPTGTKRAVGHIIDYIYIYIRYELASRDCFVRCVYILVKRIKIPIKKCMHCIKIWQGAYNKNNKLK